MQRVMIIGQPGSGKSTLARRLGSLTGLPVVHIDQIHWSPGWVERSAADKGRLCAQVHARPAWIFEGGHSASWPERIARADTIIWLDLDVGLRLWRVIRRTLRDYGKTRPDLPENCPERFDPAFFRWIWNTRHSAREQMRRVFEDLPTAKAKHHLRSPAQVERFTRELTGAYAP